MSFGRPRFSIVIPCYNEALFIQNTLESLKQQTFRGSVEVIVVDNNCADETGVLAKSYGATVVYESHPGVTSARQAGTAVAAGEIVVSTDADTVFEKNWLEKIDLNFKKHKSAVAVAGPCKYLNAPIWGKLYPKFLFGGVNIKYRLTGRPFYVTATNIAFKKSAWQSYNTTLTQGGDELDLLSNLQSRGKVVFDNTNPTLTSARRLEQGFIYNFVVTFLIYYILAYNVNKLFNRTVFGTAPAYRTSKSISYTRSLSYKIALATVAVIALAWIPVKSDIVLFSHDAFTTAGDVIRDLI